MQHSINLSYYVVIIFGFADANWLMPILHAVVTHCQTRYFDEPDSSKPNIKTKGLIEARFESVSVYT